MNYLQLQEKIKGMSEEAFVKEVIEQLPIKHNIVIETVQRSQPPYETHYSATATVTIDKDSPWLALDFILAGWYGASLMNYYQMKAGAQISLDIRNTNMPNVKHLNIVLKIKRARK